MAAWGEREAAPRPTFDATAPPISRQPPQRVEYQSPPDRYLIEDIPFIGWDDDRIPLEDMNPSNAASMGMAFEYWGRDIRELFGQAPPPDMDKWVLEPGEAASLDDVKPMVASGIPVPVGPTALTPFAHPSNPTAYELGLLPEPGQGLSGNLAGVFLPLDSYAAGGGMPSIAEDLYWSSRVIVGYDDPRRTVTLHDPTFGPNWVVGIDEFDEMWRVGDRSYSLLHPREYQRMVIARPKQRKGPSRTPDDDASVKYVFGYALSAIERNDEAETVLREGLAIAGISAGYRFLLLLELAIICYKIDAVEEAISLATEASELFPKLPASWLLLVGLGAYPQDKAGRIVAKAKRLARRKRTSAMPRNLCYSQKMAHVTGSKRRHG